MIDFLGEGRRYALPSFVQQRLWFLERLDTPDGAYNLHLAYRLVGRIDPAALAGALQAIVRRHRILETRLRSIEGRPAQVIRRDGGPPLRLVDLGGLEPEKRAAVAARLVAGEAFRPFDLAPPSPCCAPSWCASARRSIGSRSIGCS